MIEEQRNIPVTELLHPRSPLRGVKRNDVEYLELVKSIRDDGVLQPILVRPTEDGYEVVEGNHRLTAAKDANLTELPCLIKEMTDTDVAIIQLKANAIRPPTDKVAYARRLQQLQSEGFTINMLAKKVGKSSGWVAKQLSLTRLIPEACVPLRRGEIKIGSAQALAQLPPHLQRNFLNDAIDMPAGAFIKRAKQARRDYQDFLLKGSLKRNDNAEPHPHFRSLREIAEEVQTMQSAGTVLHMMEADTPLDGWKACLTWCLHLDPLSRRLQQEKLKRKKAERLDAHELRKLQRQLTSDLLKDGD